MRLLLPWGHWGFLSQNGSAVRFRNSASPSKNLVKNGAKGHAKNDSGPAVNLVDSLHSLKGSAMIPASGAGTERYGEYGNGQAVQNGMKTLHAELGGPLVGWRLAPSRQLLEPSTPLQIRACDSPICLL